MTDIFSEKEARPEVLWYCGIHVKRSSVASRILRWLYPDKKASSDYIGKGIGVDDLGKRGVFSNLVKRRLLSFDCKGVVDSAYGSKKIAAAGSTRVYFLTQIGRWFAISQYFDLSFLGICAIADAYCLHLKLERERLPCFYVFPRFAEFFGDIYATETLRYNFEQLKIKKLAFRSHKKSIKIYPTVLAELSNYHEDLLALQNWMFDSQSFR